MGVDDVEEMRIREEEERMFARLAIEEEERIQE